MKIEIGLFGIVFVVLLVLKLAQVGAVASLPWVWVCAPLWGPFAVVLVFLLAMLVAAGIGAAIEGALR